MKKMLRPKQSTARNKLLSNIGFTLIELLIYMGLLTVVLLVFTEIFITIVENQLSSRNVSNVSSDGRYIYSRMIYDINRADSITEPSALGSSAATLSFVADGSTYTYSLSDNDLLLTDSLGSNNLNGYGTTISDLSFTRIGNVGGKPTIRINYTVTGTISRTGTSESKTFQTTVGIR